MAHTAEIIRGDPVYTLLDDQLVAYQAILATVRKALKKNAKQIVILRGGPGTGKSVLALNIMATLLRMGVNAQHVTGSKAFTETLWKTIGTRSKPQFRFSHHFSHSESNEVDVLLMDEAHRLRASSNNRFTPKARKSTKTQVDEIIDAARVVVFFIDDNQIVRPSEVGSTQLIREAAILKDIPVVERQLGDPISLCGMRSIRRLGRPTAGSPQDWSRAAR